MSLCILVLGMHRSGTSAVTRALQSLGVDLGDRLMPGLDDNPKGFFEDLDLTRINNTLLEAMGKRWDSLLLPPWKDVPRDIKEKHLSEARDIIARRFLTSPCWAFKDPRTVRLLPFWEEVLHAFGIEWRFLIAYRHPLSVSASLAKRDGFDEGKALLLWLQHMLPASQVPGALVVDYDLLLEEPDLQFARMAGHFHLKRDEAEESAFREGFLDGALRHNRQPGLTWEGPGGDLGRACQGLHRLFFSLARDEKRPLSQWETARADAQSYVDAAGPLMGSIDSLSLEAQRVPHLERHIRQLTIQHQAHEKEIESLRDEKAALEVQRQALEERALGLARELETASFHIEFLKEKKAELETQLESLFKQFQRQKNHLDEIAALQRQLIHRQHQLPEPFLVRRRGRG